MEPIGNAMQWNENHNSFRASANNADVDADADSLCIHSSTFEIHNILSQLSMV